MRISINATRGFYLAFIAIFLGLILVFPISHSGDGWGYAADTLEYQNKLISLLSPHHLLYMPWCALWFPIFQFLHIDPMAGFTFLNFTLAVATLEVIRKWLLTLQVKPSLIQPLIWILLGSFGILRFALDNETYIVPLFLAVTGSFLLGNHDRRSNALGWFALTFSVLFHQSYIFWFASFAAHSVLKRKWIFPLLSSLFIVAFYTVCSQAVGSPSVLTFVLHDVQDGLVSTTIGPNNFLFTGINVCRTVFQIHGSALYIIKGWMFLSIMGLGGLLLSLVSLFRFCKGDLKNFKVPSIRKRLSLLKAMPLFWAMLLQLGFAFYSVGNAEFMVMLLPMSIILMAKLGWFSREELNHTQLNGISLGMWVYHGVFVILPLFLGSFSDIETTAQLITQQSQFSNPKDSVLFISNQSKAIENACEYSWRTSNLEVPKNLIFNQASSEKDFEQIVQLTTRKIISTYTDETIIKKVSPFNRAKLSENAEIAQWMQTQSWSKFQTNRISSPFREIAVYQLEPKATPNPH